jgi:ATP-binding cassette subfamily B protein
MAKIIDVGIPTRDLKYIYLMTGLMLAISTGGYCFAIVCQYLASIVSQGFGTLLRDALIKKISGFERREIDLFGSETLLNRATSDVIQLQQGVAMLIRLVMRAPFLCVGGIVMAFVVNKKLALILLAFIPVFILAIIIVMKTTIPIIKEAQKLFDRLLLILKENLYGARVIRAYARKDAEINRFKAQNAELARRYIFAGTINSALPPATTFITNVAIILILYYGGFEINLGFLTAGELIALINYANQIMAALVVAANLAVLYNRAFVSANRIIEILNVETTIRDIVQSKPEARETAVEFKNVCFSYSRAEPNKNIFNDNAKNSLTNISFKLRKGATLGVIGGTGAGKTTLINLIPRFDDAASGEVLVNGENVKNWDLESLRKILGVVPQTPRLFRGTIASNIRAGKKDASDSELRRAAEIAQAAEFIDADPRKFSAPVELTNLSGGQRQRLTIARALVRDPEILILDDSSSALDFVTDFKLRTAIKKLNSTTIIVSQRVSAVKDADLILVLEDGKIEGAGTHSELTETNERYKRIVESQK